MNDQIHDRLKSYYQSSTLYRDDLITHDEEFLKPFIVLIDKYLGRSGSVLDLGCGTGLSTHLLSKQGYDTVGLDLSPLFLQVVKEAHPDTSLLVGSAFETPFADESFDAVVAFEFIEHIPDVPRVLNEMLRVLKPNGYLILHSPNLISPYLPGFDILRMMLGGEGRPVFAETLGQAFGWFRKNLGYSLKKRLSGSPDFVYREPDLSENRIGGDADSVYLANQMDIAHYLKQNHCKVLQRGHAMSFKNKCLVTLTPNFAPYMGVVAQKLAT